MKLEFKPEDFDLFSEGDREYAAKRANILLKRMLQYQIPVYGSNKRPLDGWNEAKYESTTHKAILVNIEPIKNQNCEHKPVSVLDKFIQAQVLSSGKLGFDFFKFDSWECYKCGIKLEAEWKEVEDVK